MTQVDLAGRHVSSARPNCSCSFLLFSESPFCRRAACIHGRGAMSAQDLAKMSALPAGLAWRSLPIRQTRCARAFAAGSAISAPPELKSQNGVLEVTFKFLTVTDSQGLVRYCYVTNTGLEAPTLRVNPGDKLIIHFQNDLPAVFGLQRSDNMAGMKMTLSSADGHHQHQQRLQRSDVGHRDQHPLPRNQCGAGLRAG